MNAENESNTELYDYDVYLKDGTVLRFEGASGIMSTRQFLSFRVNDEVTFLNHAEVVRIVPR